MSPDTTFRPKNWRQRHPTCAAKCRAIQSNASKGWVGNLEFSFTGPWQIISSADGGLYNIEHCHHPTWWMKKHAADLTPHPAELIPFDPINGPDTQYSQLHKAIDPHQFKEAGISGFLPLQPFKVPAKFLNISNHTDFWWPTLSELNGNVDEFPWSSNKERRKYFEDDTPFFPDIMYTGPPPEPPVSPLVPEQSTLSITSLAPLIILSPDKLVFVSHSVVESST